MRPRPAAGGKGFPLGEAVKKGTSEPFLTEEGTQVRFSSLIPNFRCSTLYPPFGVLSPKGKAWVLPHQCVERYITVCIRSNESIGPYGVTITTANRHEKAEGPAFKLQFIRKVTIPSGAQWSNEFRPESSRIICRHCLRNLCLPQ